MRIAVSTFALLLTTALAMPALAVESGLEVGTSPPAFHVTDCTGPSAGTSLCYRCQYGNRPVVTIFTHELTEEVASLVQSIDEKVADNEDKRMAAFVVYLSSDPAAAKAELEAFAEEHGIENTPLTTYADASGPGNYDLSSEAGVTVLQWNESEVKANNAFAPGELDKEGVDAVVAATATILE